MSSRAHPPSVATLPPVGRGVRTAPPRADGTVVAWGFNTYGQTNVPASVSNAVAVSAGFWHTVALREDGSVVGWGHNAYGQTNPPASVSNAVAVAAGGYHTVALLANGTLAGWGNNAYGQRSAPASATNVVGVAAGAYHSLALRGDGTVVAWGDNASGQINVPASLTNVVSLAGGGSHTVVLGFVPGTVGPQSFAAQPVAGAGDLDPRPVVPAASEPPAAGRSGDLVPAVGVPGMAARAVLSVTGMGMAARAVLSVTGMGTVSAPAGALVLAPELAGRGEFALRVARAAGGGTPAGHVAFVWSFGASRYEIVSTQVSHLLTDPTGHAARLDGACAINGVNGFTFTVIVVRVPDTDGVATQRLRLQVRDAATETVVLDTQPGTGLEAEIGAASQLRNSHVTSTGTARD